MSLCSAALTAPQSSTSTNFAGNSNNENDGDSLIQPTTNQFQANDINGDFSRLLPLIELVTLGDRIIASNNNLVDSSVKINSNPTEINIIKEDSVNPVISNLSFANSSDLEQLISVLEIIANSSNGNAVQTVDDSVELESLLGSFNQLTNAESSIPNAIFSVDYQIIFGQKKWN